jgi:predicted TIM-barrel fold metal-dependent hydrolase
MAHLAGVTPFLLFRFSGLTDEPKFRNLPEDVETSLKRFYYDVTQSVSPGALRAVLDVADPSRILFGTDYPFARSAERVVTDTLSAVRAFDGFDDALRDKVLCGNARALFPRFAQAVN